MRLAGQFLPYPYLQRGWNITVRETLLKLVGLTIARKITVVVLAAVLVAVLAATGFYVYRQTTQNLA